MNKAKVIEAMKVINGAQQAIWELSHRVGVSSKELGGILWGHSVQIEHALLVLNEEVLGGESYFDEDVKPILDKDDDAN